MIYYERGRDGEERDEEFLVWSNNLYTPSSIFSKGIEQHFTQRDKKEVVDGACYLDGPLLPKISELLENRGIGPVELQCVCVGRWCQMDP